METANCCVLQTETTTSSRSTFCGERKLLHILEDIIQPQSSSTDAAEGDDDNEKARREVAQYTADVITLEGDS